MANNEPYREETLEGRLLLGLADWLTTLLLAVGMVLPCLSAYGISGRYGFDYGAVIAFCVFGSLAAAGIFTWRHGYWAALAVLAAGGLVFWRLWAAMAAEWDGVREPGLSDLIDTSPGALFLLYALVVLTLGWVVVRVRVWWLAAALTAIPVLPAIQAGVLPAWGAMLAGFAGWGAMLLTGLFSRRDRGSLARARFLSLGGMAALLVLLVMCLPREGYTRPPWATQARADLIRAVKGQLERFFDPEELESNLLTQLGLDLTIPGEGSGNSTENTLGDGPNAMEISGGGAGPRENLLNAGPLHYMGRRIMTISTNQRSAAGRLYMRGVSFDTYTGTSWESGRLLWDGTERFPVRTAPEAEEYTMSVRYTAFRGVWYYPYRFTGGGTINEAGRITGLDSDRADDPYLLPVEEIQNYGTEVYQVTYVPGGPEDGFVPLSGSWANAEESYRYGLRAFEEAYLDVPQAARESLEPLLPAIEASPAPVNARLPEQYREPVAAAARTAGYLASAASYDPETPAMEAGEDFIAHFLEEGRGYCVHFATAGALLLRMQGIPARYVSGYVAELTGSGQGTVEDSDAHAWVEIYLDGYGWYPVEMTPGYSGGESGVALEGASESVEPDSELSEDEPDEEEELDEEDPGEDSLEDGEDSEESSGEEGLPSGEEEAAGRRIAVILKVLFGLAAFWAVFCALYLLALLARKQARADKDTNRSVLNAYGRYKRLRRWGCGEDEELARLAKKAKFSQHTLTAQERETAWKCLDEDLKQSRVGQPIRRRWLLAVLCPLF